MSFAPKRFLLWAGLALLPVLVFVSLSRQSGNPPPSSPDEAGRTGSEGPAEAGLKGGFRDPGALQDDMTPPIPLSEEELSRFIRPPEEEGVPAVVEGRRYYQGTAPALAWAEEERLLGPYRKYLPDPPSAEDLEEARQQAFDLLREAEGVAAASEAGSAEARPYYVHALRHFNSLSLRFAGDADIQSARAQALNGIARTLPPADGLQASSLAADLAREALASAQAAESDRRMPLSAQALTQWGVALMGMARPKQGAERDLLFARAEEKLRRALEMNAGQAATAYALALAAAEKGDGSGAKDMLRMAAHGRFPVSGLQVASEEAFAALRAAPWFDGVAGAFPAPAAAELLLPGEAAAWMARERTQARPARKNLAPGARLLLWARRLASTSGWESDQARSELMYAEIRDLFSRAQKMADPPLTQEDYLLWGDILSNSFRAPCTPFSRSLREEAIAVYRKALALDPSSLNAVQSLFWSYDSLLACPGSGEDRERIFAARNSAALDYSPADAADMLPVAKAWAYHLADWARESPAVLRERRSREGIAKLEQTLAVAEQNKNAELAGEARRSLVYLKLYLASFARSRESREALAAAAEADARLWLSALPPDGGEEETVREARELCLDLARAFDGDPDGKRRYALEALRRSPSFPPEEWSADLSELAGVLEQMGIAERNPGGKRELLYLAATLFLRDLEREPCEAWSWVAWAVALNRLAQVLPPSGREAVLLLARDVLLWEEALNPGSEAYNVACIFALLGKPDDCRYWLERAGSFKTLPSRLHMQTDTDMDPVRGLPWFTDILPGEEKP
jgi:hypothetical protein